MERELSSFSTLPQSIGIGRKEEEKGGVDGVPKWRHEWVTCSLLTTLNERRETTSEREEEVYNEQPKKDYSRSVWIYRSIDKRVGCDSNVP